jgi:hypothetical protein
VGGLAQTERRLGAKRAESEAKRGCVKSLDWGCIGGSHLYVDYCNVRDWRKEK